MSQFEIGNESYTKLSFLRGLTTCLCMVSNEITCVAKRLGLGIFN